MEALNERRRGWINDPTTKCNLQLNRLIEYLASFELTFKIKYPQTVELVNIVNEYLEQAHYPFSRYTIDEHNLKKWLTVKNESSVISLMKN